MDNLAQMIGRLETAIRRMEEEEGWNLSQNLYNRDWKKDIRLARNQLRGLKSLYKQGVPQ
jgi:hypothetical protein